MKNENGITRIGLILIIVIILLITAGIVIYINKTKDNTTNEAAISETIKQKYIKIFNESNLNIKDIDFSLVNSYDQNIDNSKIQDLISNISIYCDNDLENDIDKIKKCYRIICKEFPKIEEGEIFVGNNTSVITSVKFHINETVLTICPSKETVLINNNKNEKYCFRDFEEKLDNMKEVTIVKGLYTSDTNDFKAFIYNDDFYISSKYLDKIIGSSIKTSYDNAENVIETYIANNSDPFLKIDMNTGMMSGQTLSGIMLNDQKINIMPIIQNNTIFLPLKCILNRIQDYKLSYFDKELNILRVYLHDYEYNFLKESSFTIIGEYSDNNNDKSYWIRNKYIDIENQYNLIYKYNNKYGILNCSVDKSTQNKMIYDLKISAVYDKIDFYNEDYNNYFLYKDNLVSIYNRTSKEISDEFEDIKYIAADTSYNLNNEYYYKIKKNNKFGLYTTDNITDIIYDDIYYEKVGSSENYERIIYGITDNKKIKLESLGFISTVY